MKFRHVWLPMAAAVLAALCPAQAVAETGAEAARRTVEAVYVGVQDYGKEETNKDNKEHFLYRFDLGGEEAVFSIDNGTRDETGDYDYPIQNVLKEGYPYQLTVEDGVVIAAAETGTQQTLPKTPVTATPGERTLKNFLKTALMPVGTTLYIYGGGWDWQDVGAANQARSLGVSPDWVSFFEQQDQSFTYKSKDGDETNADPAHSYYPYGGYNEYYYAGLDCSGYVGWALYNTFETESGGEGYVVGATGMAKGLSERGWGTWTQRVALPDGRAETAVLPGSIMSINGHVWISLGTCADGSVVIAHSTPSFSRAGQPGGGVQLSAVSRGAEADCEAYRLADETMAHYYPAWYARYQTAVKDAENYFVFEGDRAGLFVWDVSGDGAGLTDPDGLQQMTPEMVLKALFSE